MTLSMLVLLFLLTSCSNSQNSDKMIKQNQATTIELTSFNLVNGVDETKFVEVAQKMQEDFLNQQEGFIKRTLVKGENNWTDVVYWKNRECIQNALKRAESSELVVPFMQMIDFNSVKMNLSEIKLTAN